jgi:hypothetical protein
LNYGGPKNIFEPNFSHSDPKKLSHKFREILKMRFLQVPKKKQEYCGGIVNFGNFFQMRPIDQFELATPALDPT